MIALNVGRVVGDWVHVGGGSLGRPLAANASQSWLHVCVTIKTCCVRPAASSAILFSADWLRAVNKFCHNADSLGLILRPRRRASGTSPRASHLAAVLINPMN